MFEYATIDSEFGRGELGIVQRTFVENGVVWVEARLELDDDHPAVQDAKGDGFDPDQAEFIVRVPVEQVQHRDTGLPWRTTAQAKQMVAEARRRAEQQETRARIDAAREELRKSGKRQFGELDKGLRTVKPGPYSGGHYDR